MPLAEPPILQTLQKRSCEVKRDILNSSQSQHEASDANDQTTMNFQIAIDLPEHGSCLAEFVAFFDYGNREWDASEPVTVHLEDENEEPLEVGELDRSSQLIVTSAVQEALEKATPSDAEIESERAEIRGDHDLHCERDAS